jgi:hypothetical protein
VAIAEVDVQWVNFQLVLDANRGDLGVDVLTKQVLTFDGHGLELGRVRFLNLGHQIPQWAGAVSFGYSGN